MAWHYQFPQVEIFLSFYKVPKLSSPYVTWGGSQVEIKIRCLRRLKSRLVEKAVRNPSLIRQLIGLLFSLYHVPCWWWKNRTSSSLVQPLILMAWKKKCWKNYLINHFYFNLQSSTMSYFLVHFTNAPSPFLFPLFHLHFQNKKAMI